MGRIGLVAGAGELPILFADIAKEKNDTVIAFALKGVTAEDLTGHVDKIHWLEWGDLKKAFLLLAVERIKKIVMLGKIRKEIVFKDEGSLDDEAKKILKKVDSKRDYSLLNEVAKFLGKLGVEVIDPTSYLKDLVPAKGILTKREPSGAEWEDVKYGITVAKALSGFDIGQTVAVKDKTVIAAEAMEGTDEAILRAGGLVKGGFVVVKVARPDQDMRFDVPLVGPGMLEAAVKANASVLALEAGKMLMMGRGKIVSLADENGISVVVV